MLVDGRVDGTNKKLGGSKWWVSKFESLLKTNKQEEKKKPPQLHAMDKNDEYAVLSKDQQSLLNQRKVDMRLENEKYLRGHSELKLMVSVFMRRLLEEKPENPVLFASQFFTKPGLKKDVLSSVTRVD